MTEYENVNFTRIKTENDEESKDDSKPKNTNSAIFKSEHFLEIEWKTIRNFVTKGDDGKTMIIEY